MAKAKPKEKTLTELLKTELVSSDNYSCAECGADYTLAGNTLAHSINHDRHCATGEWFSQLNTRVFMSELLDNLYLHTTFYGPSEDYEGAEEWLLKLGENRRFYAFLDLSSGTLKELDRTKFKEVKVLPSAVHAAAEFFQSWKDVAEDKRGDDASDTLADSVLHQLLYFSIHNSYNDGLNSINDAEHDWEEEDEYDDLDDEEKYGKPDEEDYSVVKGKLTKTTKSKKKEEKTMATPRKKKTVKEQLTNIGKATGKGVEMTAQDQACELVLDMGKILLPDSEIKDAFLATQEGRAATQLLGSMLVNLLAENAPQLVPENVSEAVSKLSLETTSLATYKLLTLRAEKFRPALTQFIELAKNYR